MHDLPQAYILPFQAIAANPGGDGEELLKSLTVIHFDRDLGKRGDIVAGETEVIRVLVEGEADAGFDSGVMWDRAIAAGQVTTSFADRCEVMPGVVPSFGHGQFDAMPTLDPTKKEEAFQKVLFERSWDDDDQRRHVMQKEAIRRRWEVPREAGYEAIRDALAIDLDSKIDWRVELHQMIEVSQVSDTIKKRLLGKGAGYEAPKARAEIVVRWSGSHNSNTFRDEVEKHFTAGDASLQGVWEKVVINQMKIGEKCRVLAPAEWAFAGLEMLPADKAMLSEARMEEDLELVSFDKAKKHRRHMR